jgi:tRNA pseudouridine38-40 synthase
MSVRNIRLVLEFDGTTFHGWQRQSAARTVQGVVEDAIARVFGARADVQGAGRTDAGVHATGYVCNFHVATEMPARRIRAALAAHLPADVVILDAEDAPAAFHARFGAIARRYAYRVSTAPTALQRHAVLVTPHALDAAAMASGAAHLVGEHDFTSFTPALNAADSVCRVAEAGVRREGSLVEITVEANRFLHHMVRVIAGTLVEVGRGRMGSERVGEILRKRDRRAAGPTAPPCGLTFIGVRYPEPGHDAPGADAGARDVLSSEPTGLESEGPNRPQEGKPR